MTTTVPRKPGVADRMPDRLADVEDWLSPFWPGRDGSGEQQRTWHELRARVFEHVAETDPRHHYEALALAGIDQRAAARYAAEAGAGTGAGADRPARPSASHSPHEKGRGDTDSTSS